MEAIEQPLGPNSVRSFIRSSQVRSFVTVADASAFGLSAPGNYVTGEKQEGRWQKSARDEKQERSMSKVCSGPRTDDAKKNSLRDFVLALKQILTPGSKVCSGHRTDDFGLRPKLINYRRS